MWYGAGRTRINLAGCRPPAIGVSSDRADVRPTKGSYSLGDASAVTALRYAQRATQRSTRNSPLARTEVQQ